RKTLVCGEIGESIITAGVLRVTMIYELDDNLILTEQIDQTAKRGDGVSAGKPLTYATLAAAGENRPVPLSARSEIVEVIDRPTLLAASQLRPGDGAGEAVIALHPSGEDEQMLSGGIGNTVLGCGQPQGQFGAEDGLQLHTAGIGSLGEARGAVEAVMIGDRERSEAEPLRLSDQIFWRRCPVKKGERRVG